MRDKQYYLQVIQRVASVGVLGEPISGEEIGSVWLEVDLKSLRIG